MGQATGVGADQALDCVITNALTVDYTGIYKADIGIKNGLISGLGKAGNPDVMAGVTSRMIIGVTTEVIARRQSREPDAGPRLSDRGGADFCR
jgi:urease alpha subunit